MGIYTYSEARQNLASVLDEAATKGRVIIRRRDGRMFALTPEASKASPLDVPAIKARMTTTELVAMLREDRASNRPPEKKHAQPQE